MIEPLIYLIQQELILNSLKPDHVGGYDTTPLIFAF
jgi:hypothetical protein